MPIGNCPFCNSLEVEVFVGQFRVYVVCTTCKARGPEVTRRPTSGEIEIDEACDKAIEQWTCLLIHLGRILYNAGFNTEKKVRKLIDFTRT
jgi:hypothetical protein